MTGFSKVLCQPSMADPHLRPGRPLRDRRADAQSHIRGYRSSCGPHLGSSGAAAGGSLGIARAGLPVRIGNGAPPSPGLGPAISRDAGGPSRAGVAVRRIVQPPQRDPSPDAPRLLIAHCSLLIAHRPLLKRRGPPRPPARRPPARPCRRGAACAPSRRPWRCWPRGAPGLGRPDPCDAREAFPSRPARARGSRGAPASRRVAPREDPGALDEQPARERPSAPRDAAEPPALGARSLRRAHPEPLAHVRMPTPHS